MDEYAHVEKRLSGKFRVRIWRNNTRYNVGTFATIGEAQRERDKFLALIDSGTAYTTHDGYRATGMRAERDIDSDNVYRRAIEQYDSILAIELKRQQQVLEFDQSIVCLVFTADHHLGDPGTDIRRAFDEAELVMEMPNTYMVTVGDMSDNFVLEKLRYARDKSVLSIPDEVTLIRRYMKLIAPKWVIAVAGNHEFFQEVLIGYDFHRDQVATYAPHALYDSDDCRVVVSVAGTQFTGRIRHKWRGNSIYNDTQGIERAAKWDQDFMFGVGGHSHAAGLIREFNLAGTTGIAALCGSYERIDAYARRLGFAKANHSTAVAIVFDGEHGTMTGFSDLDVASQYMNMVSN